MLRSNSKSCDGVENTTGMTDCTPLGVSVITVCLNAVETIDETVQSVLAQTYADLQYIVVDGASTDGTLEHLYSYSGAIANLVSESDTGLYDAMNKALGLVDRDVVVFMNADDKFVDANVVERMVTVLRQHPEVMIAYGDYIARTVDGDTPVRQPGRLSKWNLWAKGVCHQTIFARREVFEYTGGFDESIAICADWDLLMRAILVNKLTSLHVPFDICVFRRDGLSSNKAGLRRDEHTIRRRYFRPPERIAFGLREFLFRIQVRLQTGNLRPPWVIRHLFARGQ